MATSHCIIKKHLALIIIALCFFIADRFLKILALSGFKTTLIPNLVNFQISLNNRLALSWGPPNNLFILIIITLITIIVLVIFIWSIKQKRHDITTPLTFILLGAINNGLDRVKLGYVIDYINIPFTVLNLADLMIIAGAVILICTLNKKNKKPSKNKI